MKYLVKIVIIFFTISVPGLALLMGGSEKYRGRGRGGNCKKRTTTTMSTTTTTPTTTQRPLIQDTCSEYDYPPLCRTTWTQNPNLQGGPNEIDACSDFEGRCLKPTVATNLDNNWFNSIREWYAPKWHRTDRYRRAQDLLGRGGPIDQKELTDGCFRYDTINRKISGFGDKSMEYKINVNTNLGPGQVDWTVSKSNGDESWSGVSTVVLTDNKNYFVSVTCWKDDSRGFFVGSLTKTLTPAEDQTIENHLSTMGFSKCHFTTGSSSTCSDRVV